MWIQLVWLCVMGTEVEGRGSVILEIQSPALG